jgi:hypothetical protein
MNKSFPSVRAAVYCHNYTTQKKRLQEEKRANQGKHWNRGKNNKRIQAKSDKTVEFSKTDPSFS